MAQYESNLGGELFLSHETYKRAVTLRNRLYIGVAMIAIGIVWVLQGLNLAFRVGFMVGDKHWVVYGALLASLGLGIVIWAIAAGHGAVANQRVGPRDDAGSR
jgi:hypothetical protein